MIYRDPVEFQKRHHRQHRRETLNRKLPLPTIAERGRGVQEFDPHGCLLMKELTQMHTDDMVKTLGMEQEKGTS